MLGLKGNNVSAQPIRTQVLSRPAHPTCKARKICHSNHVRYLCCSKRQLPLLGIAGAPDV